MVESDGFKYRCVVRNRGILIESERFLVGNAKCLIEYVGFFFENGGVLIEIVFLHTIKNGPASKSYGIQVAKMAGVPWEVIEAALAKLAPTAVQNQMQNCSIFAAVVPLIGRCFVGAEMAGLLVWM